MFLRAAGLYLLVICGSISAPGETPPFREAYRWVHFTTESGLPSNTISQIYETDDSTLWVATPSGLAWFDGFKWTSTGQHNYRINGQFRGGLLLNGNDSLFWFSRREGVRFLLNNVRIGFRLSHDSVLVLNDNNGVLRILIFPPSGVFQTSEVRSPSTVYGLFQSRSGTVWADEEHALGRWIDGQWQSVLTSTQGQLVVGDGAHALSTSVVDNISGDGLAYISHPPQMQGIWEWHNHDVPKRPPSERAGILKAMDISRDHRAIAVYRPDLVRYRVDGRSGRWQTIDLGDFGIDDVESVRFRFNGDLLIGTRHGLFCYRSSASRWQSLQHPPPDPRNNVNEILRASDGALWIATSDGLEIRSSNGECRYFNQIDTTHLYAITGIGEDRDGNIWISSGSAFTGAFRWDKKVWKHFAIGEAPDRVAIHKIRKDRNGNLWFLGLGTTPRMLSEGQPGAFVLRNGIFTRWGEQEGLLNGRVYAFVEDGDGSLWFGTANGLSRWKPNSIHTDDMNHGLSPADGTWTYWTQNQDFRGRNIYALAVDSSNRLWFAPWGRQSLVGYVSARDSLRYYSASSGLACDRIYDLRTDSSGTLWLATNAGLYSYGSGIFIRYDARTGLSDNELNTLFPTGDKIIAGTLGTGLAILDNGIHPSPPPEIAPEEPIVENRNALLRWRAFAFWGELTPADIPARYRVNNDPWSAWEKRSFIELKDLGPGDYSVQIQAQGLFGQYDPPGARTSFTVLPPLVLRPIVLFPGILAALGIVGLTGTLLWRKRKYDLSIRASEERYRMITELMSDYAYLASFDERGRMSVVWLTESFTRVTGYSVEEARAPGFFETIVYDGDISGVVQYFKDLLNGVPGEVDGRIITKQGALLWIGYYSIPIFDKKTSRVTHIYGIARDITQRKKHEEQLQQLATELSQTEEQERRRMATFLHDSISQSLLISKMKLEALRKSVDTSMGFGKSISEVSAILQQTIENSRALTFDLCPPILYDLGLAPAVDWLAEQVEKAHELKVNFVDDGKPKPLSNELRNTMYTGAREALLNIVKHARAKNVWIDIRRVDGDIVLAIEDDGVGFELQTAGSGDPKNGGGFGLSNLRERMTHLGGRFEIDSSAGKGTRITFAAPGTTSSGKRS
jgi:PAS domain S-box-containing protein